MLDNGGVRAVLFIVGFVFFAMGSCGAMGKVADEGWDGPSSKPGAAKRR